MMQAAMMSMPLTLDRLLDRAGRLFGSSTIVSRLPDKTLHRYTYADFHERALALAGALQRLGLRKNDRVATLMWNHYAHLEAYFAVPCAGGVLHTLNLRLAPEDIAFIVKHAGDRFLIVDDVLLPLYEKFKTQAAFEHVIVVPLTGRRCGSAIDYEALLEARASFDPPVLDENDPAGMCYTSGTTGRPKGVVYSHRSIVLHTLATGLADYLGLANRDTVTPVVPMFHVNAWGMPFTALMVGANVAFPGPHLDAASLLDLYETERVTVTAGVPTIWHGIFEALEREPARWRLEPGLRMIVGGAACPEALIRGLDRHGVRVIAGWGMTETSPVGLFNFDKRGAPVAGDAGCARRAKAGVPLPFFEVRAMVDGREAPHDGTTMGELEVRGPWVASGYHDAPGSERQWTSDGWFRTGDIATIDEDGYVKITDRIKDLVKSGGEWISSIDLENALASHPDVQEAAVIAVPHPKWGERPVAVIVPKPGATPARESLHAHLSGFAPYARPEAYVFVDAIPRTSTGKMLKAKLRETYKSWRWA
jgi:fatty-acyl-CoA synthase